MKISTARINAFDILLKIEKEKAFSSILLANSQEKLNPKDRALTHEIVLGVLRKKLFLNLIIESLTNKKISKFDREVVIALQIGIYQILFLEKIPVSAAVNESVNLIHRAKKSSAKGLVNAVLRKIENRNFDFKFESKAEEISILTSHPLWLIEKWIKEFGASETEKLALSNNQIPPPTFRLTCKSDKNTLSELEKLGTEMNPSEIANNSFSVVKAGELLFEYAKRGKIYFQDEASQLVADIVNLQQGEIFLDVCASPGSKTTLIAKNFLNKQTPAQIFAGDLHFNRVKFLKENSLRQECGKVQILSYDAEESLPFPDESFDKVLTDVPCSGTGTIRRNPEIRYSVKPADFEELPRKQLKILQNASKTVKSGGQLIYSSCSLENEENEEVINKFLRHDTKFSVEKIGLPEEFQTREGLVRTFPQKNGTDGFFMALLRKA